MREIKFRGKRLDNGEWVYGDYHHRAGGVHCIIDMQPDFQGKVVYVVIQVDADTVSQFTGHHDLNDKRIYEGDIVKFTAHDALGNELGNQQGVVNFKFGSYLIGGYNMYDILLNDDEAEIVGNIHDNPELLKSL